MTDQNITPAKKAAILDAALDLIAVHGFHGTPTSRIAREAGAGVGSIYRYFRSKDELIQELFDHVAQRMSREVTKDIESSASIRDQFIRIGTNVFVYLAGHPKVAAFIEQYFNSPYGISHKRDAILNEKSGRKDEHPLNDVLTQAREQGLIKDFTFHILGALSFGPIVLLVRDIHAGLIDMDDATVKRVIEACWDSIRR
ncbi:MAG TPA: TetR/AcrR family transcriptional regulator [Deltaproteobacteria bacterium]|nr:TetR/AcrR family transcriptional regulator [Deltaproteobacteria bacterium]HPR56004.1 TetR/AcrR family transcriptional regulator [Deltaproteobacteria bacterium]HXK48379.1 TetR/AcrR family transcriptional regulator [Deltaproteobacteria bacterium]